METAASCANGALPPIKINGLLENNGPASWSRRGHPQCPDSEQFLLKLITLAVDYLGHGFPLMLDEGKERDFRGQRMRRVRPGRFHFPGELVARRKLRIGTDSSAGNQLPGGRMSL